MERQARPRGRRRLAGAALAAALLAAACSFEVTNPGPVQDQFLGGPLARAGIVAGIQRALLDAHYDTDRNGASGAREIFPGGNVGRHGVNNSERQGIYDMTITNGYWSTGQNARWLAEDAIARFKASMSQTEFDGSLHAGMANLWAGYANRHMGEHFCQAVIDGGPLLNKSEYFARADTFFTRALTIFTTLGTAAANVQLQRAARAGRASARAHLGQWTTAAADAAAIPAGFVYYLEFFNLEEAQWNSWVAATASEPFRTITVWNTFYQSYFQSTGDPRVRWDLHPTQVYGSALVAPYGNVLFYRQRKYTDRENDVRLSSWGEMQLILAEERLVAGDAPGALAIINALRATYRTVVQPGITAGTVTAGQALPPWTGSTLVEVGTAFKKEHGIELWLEGRRLGARHRWVLQNLPGDLTAWELPSTTAPVHNPPANPTTTVTAGTLLSPNSTLCMAVPQSERDLNPNF